MEINTLPWIEEAGACFRRIGAIGGLLSALAVGAFHADSSALAQSVSGASSVRSFDGGSNFQGRWSLYMNQGTQGFLFPGAKPSIL